MQAIKDLTAEQQLLIKKPLPAEAVKPHPTKQGMSTIKAIYVTERLNDVFGIGKWTIKTDLLPATADGNLFTIRTYTTSNGKERTEYFAVAKTVLEIPDYGVHYECIAGASNDDMGDAAKGATTDAITKICSYLGIGIDVFKGQHDQALKMEEARVKLEISKAAMGIKKCETVEQLKDVKAKLPEYVLNSRDFKEAATERFNQISMKQAA
ncbi:hypothetical protein [Tellurirhabdus bombi]|uniref:hypothetical protein n=1 Tax=Tellurirhabdus bombi TaxID=2907205 RepID=UPI001F16ED5C|nr:hypothetical protein [Tellurirhabdus bombi]